ncbi:MAG: hypothetical protein RIR37_123 [Verrucomicrobiota bacterium]
MLDSNEAAGFDEAIRQDPELRDAYREMNALCAAVAAVSVAPLPARAGQLEQLQARLGLQTSKSVNWLGISGWAAAAAALTFILLMDHKPSMPTESVKKNATPHAAKRDILMVQTASAQELAAQSSSEVGSGSAQSASASRDITAQGSNVKSVTKIETKRLVQEIAVLREKLESVEKREQQRMEPVQGMAWPIVMKMRPPSATTQIVSTEGAEADAEASVVDMLGDALAEKASLADNRAKQSVADARSAVPIDDPTTTADINMSEKASLADNQAEQGIVDTPSAVPIYDPATGTGTLVVNNLSNTNFWVTARGETEPRLLGKIPPSSEAYESVGFELPVGTIPDNFMITNDSDGKNAPPSDKNTILIGPR